MWGSCFPKSDRGFLELHTAVSEAPLWSEESMHVGVTEPDLRGLDGRAELRRRQGVSGGPETGGDFRTTETGDRSGEGAGDGWGGFCGRGRWAGREIPQDTDGAGQPTSRRKDTPGAVMQPGQACRQSPSLVPVGQSQEFLGAGAHWDR